MDKVPEIGAGQDTDIPQPLYTQPDAFVENVYAHPLSVEVPDLVSQALVSNYLVARIKAGEPKERVEIVLTPSGKTLPKVGIEVVGTKETRRLERGDDWLIRPRTAVAVWASSLALLNAAPIAGDVNDEIAQLTHRIGSALGLGPEGTYEEVTRSEPRTDTPIIVKRHVDISNQPGSVDVDELEISDFKRTVQSAAEPGAEIEINVTALSSDEYGNDASLGVAEPADQDMSDERKTAWSQKVAEAFPSLDIQSTAVQDVLSKRELSKLARLAEIAGFEGENSLVTAIRAADKGEGTAALRSFVAKHFKRGVTLTALVQNPDKTKMVDVTDKEYIPAENSTPKNPNRDYDPFFVPLPWLRKRRWVSEGERDIRRWRIRPGKDIFRPMLLRESLDQAWLRIRPEAITDQKTLVDDAWAYTQKYEHLLRDGRIAEVLRADIKDTDGKESSLRIFFVDRKPQPETVAAYTTLLKSFAAMKTPDGQTIADNITGMFVLPTEQSGLKNRNPKNMGVGIDQQYDEDVLGVIYYPLKLVELHMPTDLKGEELQVFLDDYRGSVWTLAHEAAGHGTDVAKDPMTLRRIYSRHISNAHVFDGDPRAQRIAPIQGKLRPLRGTSQTDGIRQFDITYPVLDKNGNVFMMTSRVDENDSRLQHSHQATIVGHEHTMYAGENGSEHYAELAGAATGITTDFSEADIVVKAMQQNGHTSNFATGYHPDPAAQKIYAESVGATVGTLPLEFENAPNVDIVRCAPEDDPILRQHIIRARQAQMLKPDELTAILAQTSQRRK